MNRFVKTVSIITLLLFLRTSMALCADQVYFYYTDPAGTPLAMSDASGTVVWRADYMPFGEESIGTSTAQNNKMFVGKEKDSESGLYYFGARYMDAGAGRFVSPDAVGAVNATTGQINNKLLYQPQHLNYYIYGLNNPYKFLDPDGNVPVLVPIIFGIIGGYISGNLMTPGVANAPGTGDTLHSGPSAFEVAGETAGGVVIGQTFAISGARAGVKEAIEQATGVPSINFSFKGKNFALGEDHAIKRMLERDINLSDIKAAMNKESFSYYHAGEMKTGYYDPIKKIFVGEANGTITTVIKDANRNYINNLKKTLP